MKCAFCGHLTGKAATHYNTERDFVCLTCALEFELGMQFGEDYESYQAGNAPAEVIARIAAAKENWEAHFAQQARGYAIPDEPPAESWPELKIDLADADYRIEIMGTAYDGIQYLWKIIAKNSPQEYLAQDRLFASKGQALDDALEFLEVLSASKS